MRYIPIKDRDSRYPIWHVLYLCRVPNIQTMSAEYIRHFGMPTSGDERFDQQIANELKLTMLSIAQMVKYFNEGVRIALVKYSDTKKIYEAISDYLTEWKTELDNSLVVSHAPLEDLIAMDRFANAVYEHAKFQFAGDYVDSLIARRMKGVTRLNRDTLFRNEVKSVDPTEVNEDGSPKMPERQSMAEVFGSHLYSGKPKWK